MKDRPEIGKLCEVRAYDYINGAETIETVEIDTIGWRITLKDWRILVPMALGYNLLMVGEDDILSWRYWAK